MDPWLVSPGEMVGQAGLLAFMQTPMPALALLTLLPAALYYLFYGDKSPSFKTRLNNMFLNIYKYIIDFSLGIFDVLVDILDIFVYVVERMKNAIIGKRARYNKKAEEDDDRSAAEMIGDYFRPEGQPGRGLGRSIGTIFLMIVPFGKIAKLKWLDKVPFLGSIAKYIPTPKTRIVKTLTIFSKMRIGIYLVNTKALVNFLKTYPGNIYVFMKSIKVTKRMFESFTDVLYNLSNGIKERMRIASDLSNNMSAEISDVMVYDDAKYEQKVKEIKDRLNKTDKMLDEIDINNNNHVEQDTKQHMGQKSEKLTGAGYSRETQDLIRPPQKSSSSSITGTLVNKPKGTSILSAIINTTTSISNLIMQRILGPLNFIRIDINKICFYHSRRNK